MIKNILKIDYIHRLTCSYELKLNFFDFSSGLCARALCIWISELNAQTKLRYLDINMDFIEQNKHLLWNLDSWECIPVKIKGNWIFITIFLTFVDSTTWQVSIWLVLVAERCTQIIAWCAFAVKLFWNLTQGLHEPFWDRGQHFHFWMNSVPRVNFLLLCHRC